jgi:hypothetical protein
MLSQLSSFLRRRNGDSLLFGALTLALFWPVFFQGKTLIAVDFLQTSPIWGPAQGSPRNPWLSDTLEYYYPSEKLYSEHVRRAELPLVNPYLFNGSPVPHGAHIWNSVWPVKVVFLLLFDPVHSYDYYAIFHFWLAGVAMTLFLRSLGIGDFASLAASLAYVLSGRAMLWLHGHYLMATLAYVPLVFLAARRRSFLGALPLAGLFFSNPQIALATAAAVFLWERSSWRFIVPGTLMAAVALVPLASIVLQGVRDPAGEARWFYSDGFRSWLWLAGLVAPGAVQGSMPPNEYNIYLGLLPLAGALLGARRDRFFAGLAIGALAIATLYPLPVWISPLSFSLPTRYLYFFTFAACVCFARGLEIRPFPAWIRGAILLLILLDLFPRFLAWNPTFDPAPLRTPPPAVAAMTGRVGLYFPQSKSPFFPPLSLYGVASIQGYDVTVPRAQADAIQGAGVVAGQRLLQLTDPESPVLDRLGMTRLVTDKSYESRRYRRIYDGDVRVYENPHAIEVAPRSVSKTPLWIGLALTLLGCAGTAAAGLLDRLRGQGYS